jgi:hypothetical protein
VNKEQATMAVGYLVGGTTGWNDEAVIVYVNELEMLADSDALNTAIKKLVTTWTEARRPPIATVLDAYRNELSRKQTASRQIEPNRRVVPFSEGVQIAQRAYEQECVRLGRTPDLKRVAKVFGRQ